MVVSRPSQSVHRASTRSRAARYLALAVPVPIVSFWKISRHLQAHRRKRLSVDQEKRRAKHRFSPHVQAHHVNPGSAQHGRYRRVTGLPCDIGKPTTRSARSWGVADLPIGARGGLRHHRGTVNEQCPIFIGRGAPDTIRTFDLRVRRGNGSMPLIAK